MTDLNLPRLLTLEEVCPLLGIKKRTGYRYVQEDELPIEHVRIGNRIMFREADVRAFLEGSPAKEEVAK